MKQLFSFALLLVFCTSGWLFGQSPQVIKAKSGPFSMPVSATVDDFLPKTVIFKIKPEYRGYCTEREIRIPTMQPLFQGLEINNIQKAVPNAAPPFEQFDGLGRELVDLSLIYSLTYTGDYSVEEAVNILYKDAAIDYAEPWYVYQVLYRPDDPDTTMQYYLDIIDAYRAWDESKGDSNVVMGIIDTGTSFTHPDLDGKHFIDPADPVDGVDNDGDGYVDNYRGWDFGGDFFGAVGGDNDPTYVGSSAGNDHGVVVSGPAGAATDNGYCIASVGFNSKLMHVRAAVANGLAIVYGYQGVIYAADHGADILNLSWGGTLESRFGHDAVRYAAINKHKMIVAAGGNTPVYADFYPASYPEVLSCTGSEMNDAFWFTASNFGSTFSYLADICAPARNIRTTKANSGCLSFSGTSLAAPIACGIGALVKAKYPQLSMEQVAQKVRVSSDPGIYALNSSSFSDKMGHGRVDAYKALTDSAPSVRILNMNWDDGDDGLVQAGDTILLRTRFINWLEDVQGLSITLSTPNSGLVEILHDRMDVGDLAMMDTASNYFAPFKIVIRPSVQPGTPIYLKFAYSGTNYTDFEYVREVVEQSYIVLDENDISMSMNGKGEYAYINFPNNGGIGFRYQEFGLDITEGGFLIGTAANRVADNIENAGGGNNNHFVQNNPPSREVPGPIAELEANSSFRDGGFASPNLDVNINHRVYQFRSNEDNAYIIMEYEIENTHPLDTLKDAYAGIMGDWEMGWNVQNATFYDPANRLVFGTDPNDHFNPFLIGVNVLSLDSMRAQTTPRSSFSFSQADKWTALTSPPTQANSVMDDIISFVSTGPFTVPPGSSHKIAFGMMAGVDSTSLKTIAQTAFNKYWCVIRGGMTTLPDLGQDVLHCAGDTTLVLDPGAGFASYAWSNGATTPTLSVDSSGSWSVTVTDGAGCTHHSHIDVVINDGVNGGFVYSPGTILVGDTVTFTDTTSHANEWGWNFHDGSNECPIGAQVKHVFNAPGPQMVTMYVGNGTCADTVTINLNVDTLVRISDLPWNDGAQLSVFPNPASQQIRVAFESRDLGAFDLQISDQLGRSYTRKQLHKQARTSTFPLDVGSLPAGIYFVKIQSANASLVKKIVIQR